MVIYKSSPNDMFGEFDFSSLKIKQNIGKKPKYLLEQSRKPCSRAIRGQAFQRWMAKLLFSIEEVSSDGNQVSEQSEAKLV